MNEALKLMNIKLQLNNLNIFQFYSTNKKYRSMASKYFHANDQYEFNENE